jgi:aminoglycoside phosphotransferase (APT) family kinase protein
VTSDPGLALDEPRPVRPGEELDLPSLATYLDRELGAHGALRVEQFPGGHSNLTYAIHHGAHEYVLRRPPFGSKVRSAHDMGREVAVLSKLAPVFDRAPRVIAYEATGTVLGAPFYVMERRHGVILRRDLPAGVDASRACELLVDTLVDLHAIDYRAAGLGDLGKPAGYVERQVRGWSERYAASQTDEVAAMTETANWLDGHKPGDATRAALIHNDYKFDNVIFDSTMTKITGVLDWEMATIGDPWMDLGTSLSYWMQADDPQLFQTPLFGVTARPEMWTRREIARRYCERAGRQTDAMVFYYAFGLFKTAVILQQIYYRYVQGLTKDARFSAFGHVVQALGELARASIARGSV